MTDTIPTKKVEMLYEYWYEAYDKHREWGAAEKYGKELEDLVNGDSWIDDEFEDEVREDP